MNSCEEERNRRIGEEVAAVWERGYEQGFEKGREEGFVRGQQRSTHLNAVKLLAELETVAAAVLDVQRTFADLRSKIRSIGDSLRLAAEKELAGEKEAK